LRGPGPWEPRTTGAGVWPRRDELHDIRQEAYARVYEAAQNARPQTAKAFLFATARHLMADRIRRKHQMLTRSRNVSTDRINEIDEVATAWLIRRREAAP
jgi:RNA polymerase sigma-70 factor (ECF subfamily)